jgi:hypothetical protein
MSSREEYKCKNCGETDWSVEVQPDYSTFALTFDEADQPEMEEVGRACSVEDTVICCRNCQTDPTPEQAKAIEKFLYNSDIII